MKLDKNIKNRIDEYFNNISAEDLYDVLTNKYNMHDQENYECINYASCEDSYPICSDDVFDMIQKMSFGKIETVSESKHAHENSVEVEDTLNLGEAA